MVDGPCCWHAAAVFFITPKFVALHAESYLINGFLVVSAASEGSRCTMWPSVFLLPASWGTFPEINTPWSESSSPSCCLHLFIYLFSSRVCKQRQVLVFWPLLIASCCAPSSEACRSARSTTHNAIPKSLVPALRRLHWRTATWAGPHGPSFMAGRSWYQRGPADHRRHIHVFMVFQGLARPSCPSALELGVCCMTAPSQMGS